MTTTEWSRSKIIMGKLEEYEINAIRFFFLVWFGMRGVGIDIRGIV